MSPREPAPKPGDDAARDAELDAELGAEFDAELDGELDGEELDFDDPSEAALVEDEPVAREPEAPRVPLPRIAIVGRPNVGKSTLANRLARRRVSIVDPHEGVTRDRVAQIAEFDLSTGRRFVEIIDTGGIGIVDRDDLGEHVERQVRRAIETSHLVLLVVDARDGLLPLDMAVAGWLRGLDKP
ncbi:MAG: GTP-binding protein, partial [Planctomycetota bacterium]